MGDWYPDPNRPGRWTHDDDAPAPDPTVTGIFQAVQAAAEDEHEDDGHVDPDEFPAFDGVTSLMIRSIGAPE